MRCFPLVAARDAADDLVERKPEEGTNVYRPICLLNVSFKIFTKVARNRISEVAQKVIRPTQTTFIPG
jgi:hypothetical protein